MCVCVCVCVCVSKHCLPSLSLQEKLSFWNQRRSDSFLISWGRQTSSRDILSFHDTTAGKSFFEREADESLTNPTSQRKAILQKEPQRKGGISFPLQRRWCAMLWEGSLLVGGAQTTADTQAHPLLHCSAYGQGQPLARKKSDRLICIPWDISVRKERGNLKSVFGL